MLLKAGAIFLWAMITTAACTAENLTNFGGRVIDKRTNAPIPSARVIFEIWSQSPPLITFTNSSGVFSFSVRATSRSLGGRVLVYDTDHARFEKNVEVTPDSKPEELALTPTTLSVRNVEVRTDSSPNVVSFAGDNWTGWFDLCSRPLQSNERIGATVGFRLVGDRSCGAWSECRESQHEPNRICWQFRIQGHSEWRGPFGIHLPAVENSRNVAQLSYEVISTVEKNPSELGKPDVWIQFAGETNNPLIRRLTDELRKHGWNVAATERIDKDYSSSLRYYHDSDTSLATEILTVTKGVLGSQKGLTSPSLEFVKGSDNQVRLQQFDLWLH